MGGIARWLRGAAAAVGLRARKGAPSVSNLMPPEGRAYYDDTCALVKKHGWACIYVGEHENELGNFGYTVGLSGAGLPELLFVVEESDVATTMLNAVAKLLVERGTSVPDGFEPFAGEPLRLRNIYPREFFEKCVMAGLWAMDHDAMGGATGMEIVLADEHGAFPPD